MLNWLYSLMGWILQFIYSIVQNYGVALILLTILIKCLILPLNIKSQKAMLKQQKLQPLLQEIQKKYAHDKEKQSQEMMKLYKENGASPMAGCLPMLLQFPIIIALYNVLRNPLSYMLGVNIKDAAAATKALELQNAVKASEWAATAPKGFLDANAESLLKNFQIQISDFASKIQDVFADWSVDFNFLGLDLARNPSEFPLFDFIFNAGNIDENKFWATLPLLLIPVLAGVTSWILSKMTQNKAAQSANNANDAQASAAQMGKTMTWMMPVMSVVFAYTLPAGIGLYWIVSNVIQLIQQQVTTMIFNKKEVEIVDTIKKNRKDSKNR